jgi:hypothetical protein
LKLSDEYLGVHYIILSAFTCLKVFQTLKEKARRQGEGGRESYRACTWVGCVLTCAVLPGAGLVRKLYTVSKHFNNLNYIGVCGTHHMQTYLKEKRGTVSVQRGRQHFLSKLPTKI